MLIAGIPYETWPDFDLGPLTIRTFGLLVGIGVVVGSYFVARELERWGVARDETYRLAVRLVIWGVVGSRVTWVLTHTDQIDGPVDLIALWEGGIQFSGGFIAAVIVAFPTFRKWAPLLRWRAVDAFLYGLTIGLAFGRIGCTAVGEHFGSSTGFFLGTTYEGGDVREPTLGDGEPVVEGLTFHQTALYEFAHLAVLFGLLTVLLYVRRRTLPPGTVAGIFCLWYGVARFGTDLLRANDNTVLGMTGAQWMSLVLVPVGVYLLVRGRHRIGTGAPPAAAVESADTTT